MPHIRTLADEEPSKKDTRNVWERTVGKTSLVHKGIALAKKDRDAEKRRKKQQENKDVKSHRA